MRNYLFIFVVFSCSLIYAENQKTWTNWLGNATCVMREYEEPSTLEELQDHIKDAVFRHLSLRIVGKGYSRNDIACTEGKLLNLKHFNHILSVDDENQFVRVEAGITLEELNRQLFTYGLTLANQPAMAEMSLAGALCTAVHGTGHTGTLASLVQEIELITADGTLKTLSSNSDSEAFAAAKVSLGTLGIIYAVTLKCEPIFHLKASGETLAIQEVIDQYKILHESNDFFQFIWNLENGQALVQKWNRNKCSDLSDESLNSSLEPSHIALTWFQVDDHNRDLATEIAVPIDHLPAALQKTKQLIEKHKANGVEIKDIVVRFVEADKNTYLSPASDQAVAYIAIGSPCGDQYIAFYQELEDILFQYQGRPHWGKILFLNHEKAAILYGVNLQKFIHVKQRLDPLGIFSNPFTDKILKK